MKASVLNHHLHELGVVLHVRDRRLIVRNANTLPAWLLQAVTVHRDAIRTFLVDGEDAEITPEDTRRDLRTLGFIQIPETGTWCWPEGDEKGDLILLGLIDPDVLDAEHERARRDINAPPRTIDEAVPVDDLRQVYPGRHRWSERRDDITQDPFPRISREEL